MLLFCPTDRKMAYLPTYIHSLQLFPKGHGKLIDSSASYYSFHSCARVRHSREAALMRICRALQNTDNQAQGIPNATMKRLQA